MTTVRVEAPSGLQMTGHYRTIVTGYFREWFAVHFSKEATIEHPNLRGLLWSEELASKLLVETLMRWHPAKEGHRPALLVGPGAWVPRRLGIDERNMNLAGKDGAVYHEGEVVGTHTFFGLSKVYQEAEILAGEAYRELRRFGPLIRQELFLQRFEVAGLDKPFKVKEAQDTWAVPVTVAYVINEAWQLVPHTPFVKRLGAALTLGP
jgi:hypothetical protein